MKLFLACTLLVYAAAFDGGGSITSEADLVNFLAQAGSSEQALPGGAGSGAGSASQSSGVPSDVVLATAGAGGAGSGPGGAPLPACVGGYTTSSLCSTYKDCTVVKGFMAIQNQQYEDLSCLSKLLRIEADPSMPCPEGKCLIIQNNAKLTNVDGLRNLGFVAGGIDISGNPMLRSTTGLGENLQHVGKDDTGATLVVKNNDALVDFGSSWDFFDGVAPGSLSIEENAVLANIKGLHTVQEVSGGVKVCGNNDLQSLAGLEKLTMIGSGADGNGLDICNNLGLMDTSAVKGVVNIAGALSVTNNAAIQALSGFETIMNVGKNQAQTSIAIKNNGQLEHLSISATSVTGSIEIEDNPNLAVLDMSGLTTLGSNSKGQSVVVLRNDNLKDLQGLRGLQGALTGAITIADNRNLMSLNGLQQVLSAGRDNSGVALAITDNAHLQTTAGIAMTGTLNGAVYIMRNPELKVLAGLQAVSEIKGDIQGTALKVYMNNVLENLVGFKGLTGDIHGAIEIEGNAKLKDLEGFSNVNSATALVIADNKEMISLHGLENTRALAGTQKVTGKSLSITNNQNLVSANALQALTLVTGGIDIEANPKLKNIESLVTGLKSATKVIIHDVICLTQTDADLLNDVATADTSIQAPTSVTSCHDSETKELVSVKLNSHGKASDFGDSDKTEVGSLADGHICGGSTSTANSLWKQWDIGSSNGLFMDVDTSKCGFADEKPRYLTSVKGESAHWQLVGVNSVYSAQADKFRLNLWHPTLRGRYLLYFAARYRWGINWLVDTSKRSGTTKAGNTGWKAVPKTKNVIYVDVNTSKSGYSHSTGAAPRYVTAIHGGWDHWKVQGAHAVYMPTTYGFRMFLVYPTATTAEGDFGPEYAEKNSWRVVWAGSYDDRVSGISDNTWLSYREGEALQITVNTVMGLYTETPAFVTSISGRSHHWMVTGAGSIYDASAQSFKIFLDRAKSATFAKEHDWRVNYLSYQSPIDCEYNQWGNFSECSKTCGEATADHPEAGGWKTATRTVKTKAYFGGKCSEPLEKKEKCNRVSCPVDCELSAWGHFGECSESCGQGTHTRTRYIATYAANGGKACASGDLSETATCNLGPCPVDCTVHEWGSPSECSTSCGPNGRRTRTRSVKQIALHNGATCPPLEDIYECDKEGRPHKAGDYHAECPVRCVQSNWGAFGWDNVDGSCSKSCDGGRHSRTREILVPPSYGKMNYYKGPAWAHLKLDCDGTAKGETTKQFGVCNLNNPCPVDCAVTPWSPVSYKDAECSKTCGGGVAWQTRVIVVRDAHGGTVCPAVKMSTPCNTQKCPVDCQYTEWSDWGTCSKSCGAGSRTRTRKVHTWAQEGGVPCGLETETQTDTTCNSQSCPIDCIMSEYGEEDPLRVTDVSYGGWRACSKTCGNGLKTAVRFVKRNAAFGGRACPETLTKTTECNERPCAIHCEMNEWSNWGQCSRSCRDTRGDNTAGVRTRHRTIRVEGQHLGGRKCDDEKKNDEQECNAHECPIDCVLPGWGDESWGSCNAVCGGGIQTRSRSPITHPLYDGKPCSLVGKQYEERPCNTESCPQDCILSSIWHDVSVCSATCDGGTKKQEKLVLTEAAHGGVPCGTRERTTSCNTEPCPIHCELNDWDYPNWAESGAPCSKQCGGGRMTRTRSVKTHGKYGGVACPPEEQLTQTAACNWTPCPIDCVATKFGEYVDENNQVKRFSDVDAEGWFPCTSTCRNEGHPAPRKSRTKAIVTWGNAYGTECPDRQETDTCNEDKFCPIDCLMEEWSNWGACSTTCGPGRKTRTRSAARVNKHGGKACDKTEDTMQCNIDICPVECEVGCKTQANCDSNTFTGDNLVNAWYNWGSCEKEDGKPATCGGGTRIRKRDILVKPSHDHFVCGKKQEEEECNMHPCPIPCEVGEWGSWKVCKDCEEKGRVVRTRPALQMPKHGAPMGLCNQLRETQKWTILPQYSRKCVGLQKLQMTGKWSDCSKNCNSGHQYQLVSRAMCSKEAVVQLHYTFRRGKLCNTRKCTANEQELVVPRPAVPALNDNSMTLDEEVQWETLSPEQARFHGLPVGHWQKQV